MYILLSVEDKYYLYKLTDEGLLHICNNTHIKIDRNANIWKWKNIKQFCRQIHVSSVLPRHEWKCLTREEAMLEIL
jgi:hypothetical protein